MTQVKRFRAPIVIGVIAGLLIGGMISWAFVFNDVSAQGDVTIAFDVHVPVTKVTEDSENVNDSPEYIEWENGASCYWADVLDSQDLPATTIETHGITDHVVITDDSGTVVAAAPMMGTIANADMFSLACVIPVDVTVPASLAYTISIQGDYVATVGGDGLGEADGQRPVVYFPFSL